MKFQGARNFFKQVLGVRQIQEQGQILREGRRELFAGLRKAIVAPPVWYTIEELEEAWGIDDSNRTKVVRLLRIELGIYFLFLAFGFWELLRWLDGASHWMFSLFPGAVLIFMAVVKGAIVMWRIDVLVKRHPVNFMQWLKNERRTN